MTQSGLERITRFGLRCLVVAGFASTAWWLSSTAAQAEPAAAPQPSSEPSVLNLVVDLGRDVLGSSAPASNGPLTTDVEPAASAAPASAPAGESAEEPTDEPTGKPAGGLGSVLRGLTAPLGLGEVAGTAVDLISPVTQVIEPLLPALRPVTATLTTTTAALAAPQRARAAGRTVSWTALRAAAAVVAAIAAPATIRTGHLHPAQSGAGAQFQAAWVGGRSSEGKVPALPEPGPLQGHLAAGSGMSTTGSGAHHEGGAFAVASSSILAGAVPSHRRPRTTDVAVLRLNAEDRTFSPD